MSTSLNWEEVHARLDRTRRALEASEASSEECTRILRTRATSLARPLPQPRAAAETLELLVFALAEGRYGVEARYVSAVTSLPELTPVPCAPAFVRGVVNHRGRILAVLDLRKLFELPKQEIREDSSIVAVEAWGMSFGILADKVVGTVQCAASDLVPPPAALPAARRLFLKGVTAEMVSVLDLEAMARDPRLVVNEEIG
jgi:purine-binding chemotaxis protein CheW